MTLGRNKDYVIRFDIETTRLPGICPICGRPADSESTLISSKSDLPQGMQRIWPGASDYYGRKRISSDPGSYMAKSPTSTDSVKKLRIPTCEEHSYDAEDRSRARSLLIFTNGSSILIFMFFVLRIGFLLFQGDPVSMLEYVLFGLVTITMLATFRALGPNELEKAFQVTDIGDKGTTVTVRVANEHYAQSLIRSNPKSITVLQGE